MHQSACGARAGVPLPMGGENNTILPYPAIFHISNPDPSSAQRPSVMSRIQNISAAKLRNGAGGHTRRRLRNKHLDISCQTARPELPFRMRELRTFDTATTAFALTGTRPQAFTGPTPVAENKSVVVPVGGSAADVSEPSAPRNVQNPEQNA